MPSPSPSPSPSPLPPIIYGPGLTEGSGLTPEEAYLRGFEEGMTAGLKRARDEAALERIRESRRLREP